MDLLGKNLIGGDVSAKGTATFSGINPASSEALPPNYFEASDEEVDAALKLADAAFRQMRAIEPEKVAVFLEAIGEEIIALGDELIQRAQAETALPQARLEGERGRTVSQLKMFAELVREGSWVEARIDRAIPNRKPLPKPDLRRMLIPLGPVVVFAASNFPLAFSVAGGDTASAFAAGNPVVVKAHPAHPGTSELVGRAILKAAARAGMPNGVFSLLHGTSHRLGEKLVQHPLAQAVGFTGSLSAGRALYNLAAARPEPIPVYAEMGSTNPVFILAGALKKSGPLLAESLMQSVALGVGQFCTNPGLVLGVADDAWNAFRDQAGKCATVSTPGTMLYAGICQRYAEGTEKAKRIAGVRELGRSAAPAGASQAPALALETNGETFLKNHELQEELFGPSTLLIACSSAAELEQIAERLPGQLTATIHGTEEDLQNHSRLVSVLAQKVGRLLFNGFPTGVEVCPAMQHGGPYPATTDARTTSVGTAAISRFARPVCFQNFPDATLPIELRNKNERQIWRMVDGQMMRDNL